jgi:predicted Zn-dependent protease
VFQARAILRSLIGLGSALPFLSCSMQPQLPSLADEEIESMLQSEAAYVLAASEGPDHRSRYRFFLSAFPRKDILGMSVGDGRIYISHQLALLALSESNHRWLLRQTLAHEIGHEAAGHAKQMSSVWFNRLSTGAASARDIGLPWYVRWVPYPTEKELEADRIGLGYWIKLGWDCRIWVRILEEFQKQNYSGDVFHPTDLRLREAKSTCAAQAPITAIHFSSENSHCLDCRIDEAE